MMQAHSNLKKICQVTKNLSSFLPSDYSGKGIVNFLCNFIEILLSMQVLVCQTKLFCYLLFPASIHASINALTDYYRLDLNV